MLHQNPATGHQRLFSGKIQFFNHVAVSEEDSDIVKFKIRGIVRIQLQGYCGTSQRVAIRLVGIYADIGERSVYLLHAVAGAAACEDIRRRIFVFHYADGIAPFSGIGDEERTYKMTQNDISEDGCDCDYEDNLKITQSFVPVLSAGACFFHPNTPHLLFTDESTPGS